MANCEECEKEFSLPFYFLDCPKWKLTFVFCSDKCREKFVEKKKSKFRKEMAERRI